MLLPSIYIPNPRFARAQQQMSHKNDVLISVLLLFLINRAAGQTGDPVSPPGPEFNFGPVFNPTMAIVMIILVSAFVSIAFFSVYVRHCSSRVPDTPGALPFSVSDRLAGRGIGEDAIGTFPTFRYASVKRLKIGNGALECAVCLTDFDDDNDKLRLLPHCRHVFHARCVDAWLSSHHTCPLCRADLTVQVLPEPEAASTGLMMFPRSHSTGHSLVQPGEDRDRFTLRLPEDVMMSLNRARSVGVLPRARSERKGFRSGSGGSGFPYERFDRDTRPDRWSLSLAPPFVLRTGSVRSTRLDSGSERSVDPLRPNVQV